MTREEEIERAKKKNPKRFAYKLYFKKNGCSMLLFKGLTYFQAKNRKRVLLGCYTGWQGSFIITQ